MLKFGHGAAFVGLSLSVALDASAAIYTCIDAKGRRLTSDRPIPECMDRPQQELSPSGSVRRTLQPSMTADERAAAEEKARKAAEEKQREDEEKRKNRALVTRFPDQASHERERAAALRFVDDAIATAQKRAVDLENQQKKLAGEAEFYKGDTAKMPAGVKKQIEENLQHIAAQKRFLADRNDEKKRINAKFDEELARLQQLWAQRGTQPVAAASSAAKR